MFASLYTNHFHFKRIPWNIFILKTIIVLRKLYLRFWLFCQDTFLAETKCDCGVWETRSFSWMWPGQGSQQLLYCRFLVGCFLAKAEVSWGFVSFTVVWKAIYSNLMWSTASPKWRRRKELLSEHWPLGIELQLQVGENSAFLEGSYLKCQAKQSPLRPTLSVFCLSLIAALNPLANTVCAVWN